MPSSFCLRRYFPARPRRVRAADGAFDHGSFGPAGFLHGGLDYTRTASVLTRQLSWTVASGLPVRPDSDTSNPLQRRAELAPASFACAASRLPPGLSARLDCAGAGLWVVGWRSLEVPVCQAPRRRCGASPPPGTKTVRRDRRTPLGAFICDGKPNGTTERHRHRIHPASHGCSATGRRLQPLLSGGEHRDGGRGGTTQHDAARQPCRPRRRPGSQRGRTRRRQTYRAVETTYTSLRTKPGMRPPFAATDTPGSSSKPRASC